MKSIFVKSDRFISRGTSKAESPRCALFFICFALPGWKVSWVIIVVNVIITVILINAVVLVAFGRATGENEQRIQSFLDSYELGVVKL